MNKKIKLKKFFDTEKEPLENIEKYEKNLIFFNELLVKGKKEDIEYVLLIKLHNYASSLNESGKHRKALKVTKEIENDIEKIKGKSEWYKLLKEGVTFQKGVSLRRIRRYNESNIEFRKLISNNPKNQIFIEWYKGNKKDQISRLAVIIAVIGTVCYFLLKIAMDMGIESDNMVLRNIGLVVAILAYPISIIWRKIIDKKDIKFEK
jgi:tetratricopeptide (TPR) repeat protein